MTIIRKNSDYVAMDTYMGISVGAVIGFIGIFLLHLHSLRGMRNERIAEWNHEAEVRKDPWSNDAEIRAVERKHNNEQRALERALEILDREIDRIFVYIDFIESIAANADTRCHSNRCA